MSRTIPNLAIAAMLVVASWFALPSSTCAQSDDFGLTETEVSIMTTFGDLTEFIPQFQLLETAVSVLQGDIGALSNLLNVELLADIAGYGLAVDALNLGMNALGVDTDYLENTVFPEITGAINSVFEDLTGLTNIIGEVESVLNTINPLVGGLGPAISALESAISLVQDLIDSTTGWMNDVINGVGGFINDAGDWVSDAAGDFEDGVEDFVDGGCFGIFCLTLSDNGEPWAFEPAYIDSNPVAPTPNNHLSPMYALQPEVNSGISATGLAPMSGLAAAQPNNGLGSANVDQALAMLDQAAYPSVQSQVNLPGVTLLHPIVHGNVQGLDATDAGLGEVDNTADLAKPISTLLAASLDEKVQWADIPPTPFAPCSVGEWAHDETHLYMCSSPNTWTRSALADW